MPSADETKLPPLITERAGVSLVSYLVATELKWIFREQPTSDLGVDGQIEILEPPAHRTGKLLGVQIKAGSSYFKTTTADGFVYNASAKHIEYWRWYFLPVILVLVDLDNKLCYWAPVTAETIRPSSRGGWQIIVPFVNVLNSQAVSALAMFADAEPGKAAALTPPTASLDQAPKKGTLEWRSWRDQHFWHAASHAVVAAWSRETPVAADPRDPCGPYLRGSHRKQRRKRPPSGDWVFGHLVTSLVADVVQRELAAKHSYTYITVAGAERDEKAFSEWLSALQPATDRPVARRLVMNTIADFLARGGADAVDAIAFHILLFGVLSADRVSRILEQLVSGKDIIETLIWAMEHEEHYLESIVKDGEKRIRLTEKAIAMVGAARNTETGSSG